MFCNRHQAAVVECPLDVGSWGRQLHWIITSDPTSEDDCRHCISLEFGTGLLLGPAAVHEV